jgi:nucleoside-diphosphate-sugar epimerase
VREVAETIARETGLPPPSLRVPYPIAMAAGYALQAFYKARGIEDPPPVSPFVVKILTRHVIYDASKAVRLLGWVPRKRALEGIAEVARASVAS